MRIHKEGIIISLIATLLLIAMWYYTITHPSLIMHIVAVLSSAVVFWVYYFFRNPDRSISKRDESSVLAPADGKIVVIEEVEETEFFNDKRKLVSIFMSPLSVHVNRAPISGTFQYVKHHPGKFLAAWDPKSSTDNERSTIVIKGEKATLLVRQIAGAMARRIITYAQVDDSIQQGEEIGFIRFGSRVDIYFPTNAQINVNLNQMVKGNITEIGRI